MPPQKVAQLSVTQPNVAFYLGHNDFMEHDTAFVVEHVLCLKDAQSRFLPEFPATPA